MLPTDAQSWWTLLRAIAAFNVLAWTATAAWLLLRAHRAGAAAHAAHEAPLCATWRLQLLLSAGYVAGCAWRSLLPVYDVPRLVMVDSWWSSVLVGRSVATLAELCFAAQWAVMLGEASRAAHSRFGAAVARAVLPMIAAAEVCSWYSVLTTSNAGHVIEESLWGASAALLALALGAIWPRIGRARRPLLAFWAVAAALYVAYMFAVDVPTYWARWLADEAQGRAYLDVAQGLTDLSTRWVVSHRWEDWKGEAIWMSLYFSAAVWLSIALAHFPRLEAAAPLSARAPSRSAARPPARPGRGAMRAP